LNTYGYVRGNPLYFNDPFGLAELSITYSNNGQSQQVYNPNVNGTTLNNILKGLPDNSVQNISLFNHGGDDMMVLADNNIIANTLDGKVAIIDSDGKVIGYFDELLQSKGINSVDVDFKGCNTASGDNNLAKQLSANVPGSSVTGFSNYSLFLGTKFSNGKGIIIGPSATYSNGKITSSSLIRITTGRLPSSK
jgi:hypothetical protein